MALHYDFIHWTDYKKKYDYMIVLCILVYSSLFSVFNLIVYTDITIETLIIRLTGSLAFILLHFILSIGPLSKIQTKFLPLLYNRRHLGVTMFFIALIHGIFNLVQFHALGNVHPLTSLLTSNTHYNSLIRFPFQILGFAALLILAMMALTSHDFWLKNLGPKVWKSLHVSVYAAYTLIWLHVILGVIMLEKSPVLIILLFLGLICLSCLHLLAAKKQHEDLIHNTIDSPALNNYVFVCRLDEIPENRAKMATIHNQKIAIFKYDHKISAVHNRCKHQHGPLGEGKIIDGCITCPWHGYQYVPQNGQSPAPFTEKVATYPVLLKGDQLWVNPNPLPEGTETPPAIIENKPLKPIPV